MTTSKIALAGREWEVEVRHETAALLAAGTTAIRDASGHRRPGRRRTFFAILRSGHAVRIPNFRRSSLTTRL